MQYNIKSHSLIIIVWFVYDNTVKCEVAILGYCFVLWQESYPDAADNIET